MRQPQRGPDMQFSSKYRGYEQSIAPVDEDMLAATGPQTPCGEYLRRFWHPFLIASELGDRPRLVRILGEDLVVFRDRSGRLGLLHKHCAHRGASLEFGIPAERGITCCYHGWQFDIDGTILATPGEPPASRIRTMCSQGAYPVREEMGLIFAYLGPIETIAPFPYLDTFAHPRDNVPAPFRMELPCNWLQVVENGADPLHNAYLHAIVAGQQFSTSFKAPPQLDFPETPIGFLSMASRSVNGHLFVRAADMIMPNVGQFPNGSNNVDEESFGVRPYITRWVVPVDDQSCFYIGVAHLNAYNGKTMNTDPERYGVNLFPFIGQTADRPYEERQLEPGDYDAVVSQGTVANRRAEHLGHSDRGVGVLRRMLSRGIEQLQKTGSVTPYPIDGSGVVRTYVHEVVTRLPDGADLDDAAVKSLGRRSATAFKETDTLEAAARESAVETIMRTSIGDVRRDAEAAHAAR